jgi:protein arginine kinase activator
MTCDICGKKKATVHLTEIVDEQMSEMHLCEECARQKSAQMEQQFGLADLLAGLSDTSKTAASKESDKAAVLKCSRCDLPYEDFRKFGRLGCGECYTSFKEHLAGLLRKIHGSNKYLGKTPSKHPGSKKAVEPEGATALLSSNTLEDLKQQLQSAIAAEDFEKAAQLRDKIRNFGDKEE